MAPGRTASVTGAISSKATARERCRTVALSRYKAPPRHTCEREAAQAVRPLFLFWRAGASGTRTRPSGEDRARDASAQKPRPA
jgi:hypothetical protein